MGIFRAYDIRGVYNQDLTEPVVESIGNGAARYVGQKALLASDCRPSSPALKAAFAAGWLSAGYGLIDIGKLPLGVACWAAWRARKPLAYITASHLPAHWNGVKFFWPNGMGFLEDELKAIERLTIRQKRTKKEAFMTAADSQQIINDYINYLLSKVRPSRRLSVMLDPGNGMAGLVAPQLFSLAGFDVSTINAEVDCRFARRAPDPFEDPLTELRKGVQEIGIAYDGDGDRMVLVDSKGRKLSPEQVAALILPVLLKKQPGPVVANVECTMAIDRIADKFKRKVIRVKVGHTWLMAATKRYRAAFGLEPSGHYVIPSLLPFDDALAVSYWTACVLSKQNKSLAEIVDSIKPFPSVRLAFDCPDERKFGVVKKLTELLKRQYGKVNTMDGVRVETENGWVLIRASNTSPIIRLTIEAKSEAEVEKMKKRFSKLLKDAIAGRV